MRPRYSNIIIIAAAILSFAPMAAVDHMFNGYVRQREAMRLQHAADGMSAEIEHSAGAAMRALERVLADSPSLCTPTFLGNVHREMLTDLNVVEALVEDAQGGQYCDALGGVLRYLPLSSSLSIPGHSETVSIIRADSLAVPLIKVSQPFGETQRVSVLAPLLGVSQERLLDSLRPARLLRLSLANGAPILTLGDTSAPLATNPDDIISAQSLAGEIPIQVEIAVPFAAVRASYRPIGLSLSILACTLCAALLGLILQFARRTSLPAFDLERAIVHGELKPYYQPVIDMRTGRLVGCEMLCRWEKKSGEIISPGAFIDKAEQTGLAIPMTVSLMQQVRADLGELCRVLPDLKVSINLFEGHFRDGAIVEDVQAIFGGSPIAFHQLVFEITERRPLSNSGEAQRVIAGLHALGARLAMDDAGTGHSNLAYLQTLGIDVIKIDRVFVDMIKAETTQVPVLDGLIAVARDLDTEIVAEGVETQEQMRYLRAHGVTMAQGYLFAPALKAASFRALAHALNAPAAAVMPLPSAA